jgi:ArsR family transcriptional regulator, virulence genes transcriptional regulator
MSVKIECIVLEKEEMRNANKKTAKKANADWQIFERQSTICKAFAHPIRLFIIHQLGEGDCSVAELQKALEISVPNLSQHLAVLKSAGIVVSRREGKRVFCSLPIPEVKQACDLVHNVLRRQIKNSSNLVS